MSNDLSLPASQPVSAGPEAATDPATWASTAPRPRCPWCSETLPAADLTTCPACRAQLAGGADSGIPGLTDVVTRAKPAPIEQPRRNRWLAWISGEVVDDPLADPVPESGREALAPPSRDVRREILRLQLEAAGLQAPPAPPAAAVADAGAPEPDPAAPTDAAPVGSDGGPAAPETESTAA